MSRHTLFLLITILCHKNENVLAVLYVDWKQAIHFEGFMRRVKDQVWAIFLQAIKIGRRKSEIWVTKQAPDTMLHQGRNVG